NDFVELLLAHDADANAAGPDGRTPYRLATTLARSDLTELLAGHGAGEQATPVDQFLYACLRADRAEARRLLDADPGLLAQLLERGASVEGITASPDDPKPPSAEVAALFHTYTSTSRR